MWLNLKNQRAQTNFNLFTLINLAWCYNCQGFIFNKKDSYLSQFICLDCQKLIKNYNLKCCNFCLTEHAGYCLEKDSWGLNKAYSILEYNKPASNWLVDLKYNGNYFSGRMLKAIIKDYLGKEIIDFNDYDFILTVPSSKKSLFHTLPQSNNLLCQALPKDNLKLNAIKKIKKTKRQSSLNKAARIINMRSAKTFSLLNSETIAELKGKNILIFDDVCTTGATIKNIAKMLLKNNVKSVEALFLFREFIKN